MRSTWRSIVCAALLAAGALANGIGLRRPGRRGGRLGRPGARAAGRRRSRRPLAEPRDGARAARLGRRLVRPRRRPDDPLGLERARPAPAPRRRDGAGRRLRLRPRDGAAGRAPAATGTWSRSMRRPRWSRPRASGWRGSGIGWRTPSRTWGAPLPLDGGVGRRDPVDGDVPLGPRPRRAVRATSPRVAPARRPARGPVRRRGEHRPRARGAAGRPATGGPARGPSPRPRRPATRLEAAGFTDIETWLNDELETFEPGAPFREYLRTVVLGAHLERLATDAERDAFVDAVAERLPDATIDYVRLNILATRALTGRSPPSAPRGTGRRGPGSRCRPRRGPARGSAR